MKTIVKTLFYSICFILILFQTSCSETTKPDNTDTGGANVVARQGFELMNDEAERLSEIEDISNENDLMLRAKFDEIEGKFTQALALDVNNPMAHLGMSILEIMRLNYDPEFWALQNDLQDFGDSRKTLLNNQLWYLSRAPVLMMKNYSASSKSALSIKRFQDFIINSVSPRLESSLAHLNKAVNLADSSAIFVDTGEELMEIDCGEIFAFRASIKVLNAAFYMLTAYNWDMVGTNGGYDWVNQVNDNHAPEDFNPYEPYLYTLEGQLLKIYYWDYDSEDDYNEPFRAEIMAKTLKHNLNNNSSFGTLNQARLTKVKTNILGAAADIRSGIQYIQNETDIQGNDIIKTEYITDMNEEISNHDPDNPPFMQEWDSVYDVIDWLEGLINGGNYTFSGEDVPDLTVNLSAFFNGAVSDIRNVIPYFHWNTSSNSWLESESNNYGWNTTSYSFWYYGELIVITNINRVEFYYTWHKLNPGYFTVSQGGVEIEDNEVPYFPDYTFGGIFPNMNRTKLIELFENK